MAENTLPPIPETLPVVATTNLVIFPFMMAPLTVGRPTSLAALDAALEGDRLAVLTLQQDENTEQPTPDELHTIGCACAIVRMMRSPDGAAQVIVQGLSRVRLSEYSEEGGVRRARVETLQDSPEKPLAIQALMNNLLACNSTHCRVSPFCRMESSPPRSAGSPGKLADFVSSTLNIEPNVRNVLAELECAAPLSKAQLTSLTTKLTCWRFRRRFRAPPNRNSTKASANIFCASNCARFRKSWAKVMTARRKSKICDASSKKRHDRRSAPRRRPRTGAPQPNAAGRRRVFSRAQLSRLPHRHSVEQAHRRQP
jgi:ATP-dependent Lon protease